MNKVLLKVFIICCFTLFSCVNEIKKNKNQCDDLNTSYSFSLEKDKKNSISFKLDSATSNRISYQKILTIKDTLYYTFLNQFNNKIYCYNYKSRKLSKTIILSSPKKLSGYEIISWDKILTYQYWSENMTLQDGKGNVLKVIRVPKQKGGNGYYSLPDTHKPLIFDGKSFYLTGGHVTRSKTDSNSKSVVRVDKLLSKVEYLYHFPEIYSNIFFGGSHYRLNISYVYNPDEDIFIFSFPASHNLFVTSDFKNESKYCASSKYIKSISEYSYKKFNKTFEYCSENGLYYGVIYDQYNKVYYRLCLLPVNIGRTSYSRDLSVIILDNKFNKIGEKILKDNVDFNLGDISTISASPDGLLIQNNGSQIEEDSVDFTCYKLIKK